jgi:predicted SprT family Zn-dependent metalloprotease
MKTIINEDALRATYVFLRSVEPFNTWKLPPPSKVEFEVTGSTDVMGEFDCEPLVIRLSDARQSTVENLLRTTAHELVHMKFYLEGKANYHHHDQSFRNHMKQINILMGWDKLEL